MHKTMGSDIGHECVELRRRKRWKQKARGMKRRLIGHVKRPGTLNVKGTGRRRQPWPAIPRWNLPDGEVGGESLIWRNVMKLIIAGSRSASLSDADRVRLDAIHAEHHVAEVVSGGAKGVDEAGEAWAQSRGIEVRVFRADWRRYRRAAGPVRNREMAAYADAVAVFPGGSGTRNMLAEARRAGLVVFDFMAG
jgi:hypothetical protein